MTRDYNIENGLVHGIMEEEDKEGYDRSRISYIG